LLVCRLVYGEMNPDIDDDSGKLSGLTSKASLRNDIRILLDCAYVCVRKRRMSIMIVWRIANDVCEPLRPRTESPVSALCVSRN
jgi:hypothetical protein